MPRGLLKNNDLIKKNALAVRTKKNFSFSRLILYLPSINLAQINYQIIKPRFGHLKPSIFGTNLLTMVKYVGSPQKIIFC